MDNFLGFVLIFIFENIMDRKKLFHYQTVVKIYDFFLMQKVSEILEKNKYKSAHCMIIFSATCIGGTGPKILTVLLPCDSMYKSRRICLQFRISGDERFLLGSQSFRDGNFYVHVVISPLRRIDFLHPLARQSYSRV